MFKRIIFNTNNSCSSNHPKYIGNIQPSKSETSSQSS